jgi:hypothetical protein
MEGMTPKEAHEKSRYLEDPQACLEEMQEREAAASMHQTEAGINDEALLAQDIQPEQVAAIE